MKRWLMFGVVGVLSMSASAASASEKVRYDSMELVQGLFFGRGPVAGLFPELGSAQEPQTSWSAEDRDAFVSHVEQSDDPDFLSDFAVTIQGGDHIEIEDAMERAEHVLDGFTLDPESPGTPETMPREAGVSWFAAVNVVAAVNIRTAVNIEVYGQVHTHLFLFESVYLWTYRPPIASRLHDDHIVALVAKRLARA